MVNDVMPAGIQHAPVTRPGLRYQHFAQERHIGGPSNALYCSIGCCWTWSESPRHARARSFYHLADVPLAGRSCCGLACFAARADDPIRWMPPPRPPHRFIAWGKCYAGPRSDADQDLRPHCCLQQADRAAQQCCRRRCARSCDVSRRGRRRRVEKAQTMAPAELVG